MFDVLQTELSFQKTGQCHRRGFGTSVIVCP